MTINGPWAWSNIDKSKVNYVYITKKDGRYED
ncbi:hypothetical protein [Salmonella enterica]